jgi:hypothetical protein
LKLTHFVLFYLLLAAALCAAQSAPKPETPDANQTAQPSANSSPQTPAPTPPPAQPPAGQPAQPADQSQGQSKSQGKDNPEAKDAPNNISGTSNDRLFFTLPNFLTLENAGQVPPLTVGQKFKVVARGSFDYVEFPWYLAISGIGQAENSEPGYGQGFKGFGKRFGANAADGTIENFFTSAILPSVLHQDPRYFQSGHGSFFDRTGYAVGRIFVTRTDSGHRQFNFSEIFGAAIAATISTYSYHPQADRNLPNTASVWGTQMGYDAITYAVKEFWPDIRRKLKKQHH